VNYLISDTDRVGKGVCRLLTIENVPNEHHMQQGRSQAGKFPTDARFSMNPDFPKDVKLADVLRNQNRFLVVSEEFKSVLAAADALKNNEVYEVGIFNHKGRREKAKYVLIHQIDFPPCADESKSVGEKSELEPTEYDLLTKLVLDESKIDPGLGLFRAAEYINRVFFRRDIAARITAANLSGIRFHELDQFDNF
jgi:hypothetical protein